MSVTRCSLGRILSSRHKFKPAIVFPLRRMLTGDPASLPGLVPRGFPMSGFVKSHHSEKIEEEQLPQYFAEDYYPTKIGEIFASRYQVVCKLGYGTTSTTWLCRDLLEHCFYTLKVCSRTHKPDHEIAISKHLKNSNDHFGKQLVRLVIDSFEVVGPHGKHACLLYRPLGMNLTEFQNLLPDKKLPKELIQRTIQLVLISVAFLHQNNVIHTDISSNNILQGIGDTSILCNIEEDEMKLPIARKVLPDRNIYYSRPLPVSEALPVLSDLGEARLGKTHNGDIMPGIYRAPEVILGMDWDCKVDIWSVGMMVWDMAESNHLFFAKRDRILHDEQHLAEMVSLLGPPPPEFIKRNEKCLKYWDEQGNWKGDIPIPERSLEMRFGQYDGQDKELFLNFLRRILRWLPDERPTAEELAYDDFLMQPLLLARGSTPPV